MQDDGGYGIAYGAKWGSLVCLPNKWDLLHEAHALIRSHRELPVPVLIRAQEGSKLALRACSALQYTVLHSVLHSVH